MFYVVNTVINHHSTGDYQSRVCADVLSLGFKHHTESIIYEQERGNSPSFSVAFWPLCTFQLYTCRNQRLKNLRSKNITQDISNRFLRAGQRWPHFGSVKSKLSLPMWSMQDLFLIWWWLVWLDDNCSNTCLPSLLKHTASSPTAHWSL